MAENLPDPLTLPLSSPHASDGITLKPDPEDSTKITTNTRKLGLVVCRGTVVMTVSPTTGIEEIANPFTAQMQPAE